MSVLLWLVPSLVATVLAMLWVSWAGRERRDEVSHEEQMRRLGAAVGTTPLDRAPGDGSRDGPRDAARPRQPGSVQGGVVMRRPRPEAVPADEDDEHVGHAGEAPDAGDARREPGSPGERSSEGQRRAS